MTPAQFWAIEMQNQQNQQENMQKMTNSVFDAMGQLAGAYNDQENMKATVKSGEKLLDVMGPSFGMTADKLKEFDYSNMSMREKAMFHQGWQGNFATMSQGYNFGRNLDQRAGAPIAAANLQNLRNVAGGNQAIVPTANDVAGTEPPLPAADPAGAPAPAAIPGGRASWDARNRDRVKAGLDPLPYPPGI
jgi:hypothetical protein